MSGALRVRAAVAFEPGAPLRIEEVEVGAPGPGQVRVRLAACSLCASDLHVWRTGEGIVFPAVLGHEASGVVETVGAGVSNVAPGDRVLLSWVPRCGACRACLGGRPHLCAALRTDGRDGSLRLGARELGRYMGISGLSESVVVGARAVIPVPESLSLRAVCTIACGIVTGFGAAAITGGLRWGESVAVFGCGGVGLAAIQGARIAGAARILAVDPNPARLELARSLGATDMLSPEEGDPVAALQASTRGGVDLAIEAVGSAAVVRQAFDALAPGGRAVVVGLTRLAEEVSVPLVSLLLDKSLHGSIHGSADPARDFPRLFELAARGTLRLEAMTGPDFALEEVNAAVAALAEGRAVRPRILHGEGS